jgi:hypothetical protein
LISHEALALVFAIDSQLLKKFDVSSIELGNGLV